MNTALTVPPLPSITLTSPIEIVGAASSFEMVPTACPSGDRRVHGIDRSSVKVSSPSNLVSPFTATVIVALAVLGGIDSVPPAPA